MTTCKVEVCGKEVHAKGYCNAHYSWAHRRSFQKEPTHIVGEGALEPRTFDVTDLSDLQVGWVVGVMDGEGCIHIVPRRDRQAVIQVRMSHKTTISRLHTLLPLANSMREIPPAKDGWKATYAWRVERRRNTKHLLEHLTPYLVTKKDEALKALTVVSQGIQ